MSKSWLFEPEEEFKPGFGTGNTPDTYVKTLLDPQVFRAKFGPPFCGTATFGFAHPEWIFKTNDTKETVKIGQVNGCMVLAISNPETVARFLAFVDRKPKPAGG